MNAVRRIALGVALTGAAAGAVPAIANAQSTCTYSSSAHRLDVTDNSGPFATLRVANVQGRIEIADGSAPSHFCFNQDTIATVGNTDTVNISSASFGSGDGYLLDESGAPLGPGATLETTGQSEIEVTGTGTGSSQPDLTVVGTTGPDKIRVASNGKVDVDNDGDDDFFNVGGSHEVNVVGGLGNDTISGTGFGSLGGSSVPLSFSGGDGRDTLSGGKVQDLLAGNGDDDTLISSDLAADLLNGGSGFDTAIVDSRDLFADTIERQILDHSVPLGRLHLAPRVVRARAGRIAHLDVSWTHPKAWRALRTVMVRFSAAGKPVGMVNVRPASGRLTADGKVKLAAGSTVGHHGKTVTARLALRLARTLGGKRLRIAVIATDRHGAKQTEAAAGSLRVAR